MALEEQVRDAQSRLDAVPGRLNGLLRRAARPEVVSFSAPDDLASAERDLLLWVGESRGEVSFAAGEGPDLGGLRAEIAEATRRLTRLLTHVAWVETRAGGRLLGQTVVGWTGTTRTLSSAGAAREPALLHQRNVHLALASRLGLLRTLVMVGRGAAILLSATSGLGAVASLPAAWKFVQQVLEEVRTRPEAGSLGG